MTTTCKKVSLGLRVLEVAGIALITVITWDVYKLLKAEFAEKNDEVVP
jgi:hypothetical protein